MNALTLDPNALEDYLPHRGLNLLPDEVVVDLEAGEARSRTTVVDGDARGRRILGRRDGTSDDWLWQECFLGELLALTGVSLLHEELSPEGKVAVFSAISRTVFKRTPSMDRPVEGYAKVKRSRNGFTQFLASFSQDGEELYSGEIMSGAAPFAEIAGAPARPHQFSGAEALQADFSFKDASMCFIDGVQDFDAEAGSLTGTYVYPEDHPFVAGHFPGAPLMMGVTQWQAVADAAWEAYVRMGLTAEQVSVNGTIVRPDGEEVIDIRDMDLVNENGVPRLAGSKRVAFRDTVRPGDGVLVRVQLAPC